MKTENISACTCSTPHASHALSRCGRRAEEFLAEPAAIYKESRRGFLGRIFVGGLTVATLPLLTEEAQADMFTPSVSDQKKMGEQAAQQILQKYHEVQDSRAGHFNQIGARLVRALPANDRNTWDYRFHVIESKEINAFALPGGHMFMFTGLMDKIKSDSELAAVTGHEMTHVRKQHWAKSYGNQQKRELGLAVILGLTKANRGIQSAVGAGEQLAPAPLGGADERTRALDEVGRLGLPDARTTARAHETDRG